jgi:signal transduction histidine kinase
MKLRTLIVTLVLVAVFPVSLFASLMVEQFFRQERVGIERELRDAVRSLALSVDRELMASVAALETLATSTSLDADDLGTFYRQNERVRASRPTWEGIAVAEPSGRPLVGSLPQSPVDLAASRERDDIRRAVETGRSVISSVIRHGDNGDLRVTIITPVRRNGVPRYLLLASVELQTLTHTMSQQLPAGWSYRIYDRNDTLVAATLAGSANGSADIGGPRAARFDGTEGWVKGVDAQGGTVYAAVGQLPLAGWSIALEVPAEVLEGPSRQWRWSLIARGFVLLAAGLVLASIFGRRIATPVAELSVSAQALARGEAPKARASVIREVNDVSRAVEDARVRMERNAFERDRVETILRASEQRRAFLADVSATLAVSLDYETTLAKLAQLAVPYLADACVVDMADASGRRLVSVAHVVPSEEAVLRRERRRYPERTDADPMVRVLRTGRAEVYPVLSAEWFEALARDTEHLRILHGLGLVSAVYVPLTTGGETIGVVALLATASGRSYSTDDLAIATDFASRCAYAVENARRYRDAEQARHALVVSEQTAVHANHAKDAFLALLSHELRTPVGAIAGWVRWLRAAPLDFASVERALTAIERSTGTQIQIINDLLDVSRIIEGRLGLDVRPLSLAPLVEAAVETIRPAAVSKNVRMSVFIEPATFPMRGDVVRLEQVLVNLLSNAVKFTPDGGRVTVTLQRGLGEARLTVSDTGEGIPAEFLPHVFERFAQAPRAPGTVPGGLGLGLAIVRHLVERHGGTVAAESKGEGQGATFTVTLPLMDGSA